MHPSTFANTMLFSSVLLLLLVEDGEGMPKDPSYIQKENSLKREDVKNVIDAVDECENDTTNKRLEFCQRCAKVTNSRTAYPRCCMPVALDKEQTFNWCKEFLAFGLPQDNSLDLAFGLTQDNSLD